MGTNILLILVHFTTILVLFLKIEWKSIEISRDWSPQRKIQRNKKSKYLKKNRKEFSIKCIY